MGYIVLTMEMEVEYTLTPTFSPCSGTIRGFGRALLGGIIGLWSFVLDKLGGGGVSTFLLLKSAHVYTDRVKWPCFGGLELGLIPRMRCI